MSVNLSRHQQKTTSHITVGPSVAMSRSDSHLHIKPDARTIELSRVMGLGEVKNKTKNGSKCTNSQPQLTDIDFNQSNNEPTAEKLLIEGVHYPNMVDSHKSMSQNDLNLKSGEITYRSLSCDQQICSRNSDLLNVDAQSITHSAEALEREIDLDNSLDPPADNMADVKPP